MALVSSLSRPCNGFMSIAELYVTFCTYLSGPSTIWLQLSFQFHMVLFPLQDHYSYSKINHSSLNLAPFYQLGAGLPRWLSSKQTNKKTCLLMQEMWVLSLGQEDPLWRKWQPTLVFLPGKSYGERSLVGYSPSGCKASDKTGRLTFSFSNILNTVSLPW